MSVKWILASGREEEKETPEPLPDEEIVILKTEVEREMDDEGFPYTETVITYAHAGNDDLLGWEITEVAATRLYFHEWAAWGGSSEDRPLWSSLSDSQRRMHVLRAQAVLRGTMEYLKEKRDEQKAAQE